MDQAERGPIEGRGTELVFIGVGLDRARLEARLDKLLLTNEELAAGPRTWAGLPDPLRLAPLDAAAPKGDPDERCHGDGHGDGHGGHGNGHEHIHEHHGGVCPYDHSGHGGGHGDGHGAL